MAVESFSELLQKLRDVHEHESEGWQEKLVELTNKKNIDTKRMEELYNRNQQLREQQRMLTENIKQLENRLRAGLCDRCTVTQDVAKKRLQEYENCQLQSLQHISILVSEMNALKKENDNLKEEVKSLRDRTNRQNGLSEDTIAPEVKMSPDTAVAAMSLLTSALKSSQPPPGDTTLPAATVKRETENSPTESLDKSSEHKLMQSWARAFSFESNKPILYGSERRAASVESVEQGHSPLSPSLTSALGLLKSNCVFSSAAPEERSNRQQIHAPVPFRPLPMQTGHLPWPLSDSTDWVTVTSAASGVTGGMAIHPSQTQISGSPILHVPKQIPPINGLLSRSHGPSPSSLRSWSDRPPRRSLSEHVDSREKRVAGGEAVTAPPQWRASTGQPERIFGENLRKEQEEEPLDLSESGRSKSKEQEKTQSDTSSSSSSYSPPAPLSSSSQYPSSPQSDLQTADHITQEEATQDKCKEQEEVLKDESSPAAETSMNSDNRKIPSVTISLQPVVLMESLKSGGQKGKVADPGSKPVEQEEKENNDHETGRKRPGQDTDALSQRPLKEKKLRLRRGTSGNHAELEQT
ncbi:uncharacterized protein rbbp8l isoform X2 [Triplophysa rosa]|nr:uncharacterized protein rbbp8l isoform X2 [Triplophysa rosa]